MRPDSTPAVDREYGDHPTAVQLAAWIHYGLPAGEMRSIEAHLLACRYCMTVVDRTTAFFDRLRACLDARPDAGVW